MRPDVSHQQATESADEALRLLVRLLARTAAREATTTTPQSDAQDNISRPRDGGDHAE